MVGLFECVCVVFLCIRENRVLVADYHQKLNVQNFGGEDTKKTFKHSRNMPRHDLRAFLVKLDCALLHFSMHQRKPRVSSCSSSKLLRQNFGV
jgi:hypothetical protein